MTTPTATTTTTTARPSAPLRLHRFALSGHTHRVELLLSLLELPYERIEVDLTKGAHKTTAFLARNAFGQVPVLEDGDVTIADSNAILVYLCERFDQAGRFWPRAPAARAEVQRWLSVAAGQLAAGLAAARRARVFARKPADDAALAAAGALLAVMEGHLAARAFFVGDAPTLADLALYAYTARAPEGGVSLEPYPGVRAWLARVEALPGFVPMPRAGE